jgi:hypothetical protein
VAAKPAPPLGLFSGPAYARPQKRPITPVRGDVRWCFAQVMGALGSAVDDRKRVVRQAAAACRRQWGSITD